MRWDRPPLHEVAITLPSWVTTSVSYARECQTDEERMRLVIRLAKENVEHGTGGPFAAAVFERESGRLISVGVNGVLRLNNSAAHAEMVALQLAQRRIVSHTLGAAGHPAHELFTSCAPCAMCLGAVQWSGVTRVVSAASHEDTGTPQLHDGALLAANHAALRARDVELISGLLRDEARDVLALEVQRDRVRPVAE